MRIVKIHINEFGPLVNKDFEFDENLTIVKGDNESGKSSLMLFIKFMLYGLSKKAKTGSVAEIDKALSHSSGVASGYMTVSVGEELYRIDRQIRRSGRTYPEKVQLSDARSGLVCEYSGSVGEFLLGIPADVFESSSSISQLGCSSVGGKEIGTAIKNLLSSADESIDSQKALGGLEKLRKRLLHKNQKGGSIFKLTTKKNTLLEQYKKSVDDRCETEGIEADLKRTDAKIKEVSESQKIADELVSKIGLRAVVKQFELLHSYEEEKGLVEAELSKLEGELTVGERKLDRSFVSNLRGIVGELSYAQKDKKEADRAILALEEQTDENSRLIAKKVAANGGIDSLEGKISKAQNSKRSKAAAALVFALLALVSAPLGFLNIPLHLPVPAYFVFLPLSLLFLALALVFVGGRAKAKKELQTTCEELDINEGEINGFLSDARKALSRTDEESELLRECEAQRSVKERVLASAVNKALEYFSLYGISARENAEELILKADETLTKITALCDKKDSLSGRLVALEAKIKETSAELGDYNENQIRRRVSDEILKMSDAEIRTAKTNKAAYANQLKTLTDMKLGYERSLIERKYSTQDPFDIAAKLSDVDEDLEVQTKAYAAIALAMETITTASANLRNTIAPQIRSHANEYMRVITDGKYDSVSVTDSLELSMSEDGFSYTVDSFSAGTKDAAYLALRLSLLALMGEDETAPLLMDETLAMIDDKRARKLLSMLSEHAAEHGQCILFSCHDREVRLCNEENIDVRVINM